MKPPTQIDWSKTDAEIAMLTGWTLSHTARMRRKANSQRKGVK